ncbi:DUF2284 domain-containing protein [Desulfosediminicola sp.]|uniref:DUF2284 domain-containing protein n=1 Tax=Desulfosediminicola sp. TaxID=2886825 RepID=UPI003AF3151F
MSSHTPKEAGAISELIAYAESIGVTRAARISPQSVLVESRLAAYCREPKCPYFGQSMSCPPHVSGPAGFKKLLAQSRHAIVLRIELDGDSLHGNDRPESMRLLHSLTAAVELEAKRKGFDNAQGFAGGSCKRSFCDDYDSCAVLSGEATCRFPDQARPSMSGYGVNVGELMKEAGWSNNLFAEDQQDKEKQMAWIAGLVLLF